MIISIYVFLLIKRTKNLVYTHKVVTINHWKCRFFSPKNDWLWSLKEKWNFIRPNKKINFCHYNIITFQQQDNVKKNYCCHKRKISSSWQKFEQYLSMLIHHFFFQAKRSQIPPQLLWNYLFTKHVCTIFKHMNLLNYY